MGHVVETMPGSPIKSELSRGGDTRYGAPFTGNPTSGIEHSTTRSDYRWPGQKDHQPFSPLQRGVPEQFRSETTYGAHFQAPTPSLGPDHMGVREAPKERSLIAESTYQAHFVKPQQDKHQEFAPIQRGNPAELATATTYAHFHDGKMPEVQRTPSKLEQEIMAECGELQPT